jgi:uncharacterized protein
MPRLLFIFLLALATGLSRPAAAADGLPARPVPFTFVTDQAKLLSAADAKKLDGGLRKYAESTGTQVVVVTVPSLNGTDVADYARQLGTAWGVGQRDKDNGIVVLLSGKEHQMSIQAGSGLRSAITPEVTSRVMQEMTPAFKQNNYFAGLRKGLSSLMLAANPSSDPRKNASATATAPAVSSTDPAVPNSTNLNDNTTTTSTPAYSTTPAEPASSGLGMGTILIGVVLVGGGIWLVSKLFKRGNSNNTAAQGNQSPDFLGNRPNGPTGNFGGGPQGQGNFGGGYGGQAPNSGSGMGGLLATGAAAAAGAYLGNRMSEGHDNSASAPRNFDTGSGVNTGPAPSSTAGSDYFASRNGNEAADDAGPDYFSGNDNADTSGDYFSGDNSSYDDTSSDDTGGGGFDSTDDTKGSW